MNIRFWGVRGSLPAPGPDTVRYGGNTSCVSIDLNERDVLIVDAGSGVRALGQTLVQQGKRVIFLLSHIHWDHIQGFPFFTPIYVPGQDITILNNRSPDWIARLFAQMDGSYFPVKFEHLAARINIVFETAETFFTAFGLKVTSIETNHPGGCLGYRFERDGCVFVYISDNELDPPGEPATSFHDFVDFCRGADLLLHDAQYVEADMPQKRGWGHSRVRQVCDLAAAAGVKRLALFHHDPARSDEALAAVEADAQAYLAEMHPEGLCFAAYEGYALELASGITTAVPVLE